MTLSAARVSAERMRAGPGAYSRFCQEAYKVLEPNTPLEFNWHHQIMCDELQLVSEAAWRGEKRDLVICVPPGSMKSWLGNVFWLAWEWGTNPGESSLNISNDDELARKLSRFTRRLLKSEWYQQWFEALRGEKFRFADDQNEKDNFENAWGGFRECVPIGGTVTGKRATRQIIDDPHDIKEALGTSQSVAARMKSVADIDSQVLTERLKNPSRQPRVLIMQRVHVDDLAGHWLRTIGQQGSKVHACVFSQEFDPGRKDNHPRDPRKTPGELLHPSRLDADGVAAKKLTLGIRGYKTQHLQQPSSDEGGMFKRDRWVRKPRSMFPPIEKTTAVHSWDIAVKGKQRNDNTVGFVLGLWPTDGKIYVYARSKKKVPFTQQLDMIRDQSREWPTVIGKVVEDAANAEAAKDTLQKEIPGIILVPARDDKVARAQAWSPCQEAYGIVLPENEEWAEDVIEEHANFPDGSHDDDIDGLGHGVIYLHSYRNIFAGVRSLGVEKLEKVSEWSEV